MNHEQHPVALVAVDTGGTFTDLVLLDAAGLEVAKVPSTPDDPSEAVLNGLARLAERRGVPRLAFQQLLHGTTVATNSVLERRGVRTAFVVNQGFRDLLTIGRQNRPKLYELMVRRTPPLAEPGDTFEIGGRIGYDGSELVPQTESDILALIAALRSRPELTSIAVCLLHSYANPAHERRLGEALRTQLKDRSISLSHEILPQFREYERASTTVLNAYVQPTMRAYLSRLLQKTGSGLLIVQSDGGMVSAELAIAAPVHTLLSGPAGGVVGAARAGARVGHDRVISFDMGGTSTDVSLIDGEPTLTRSWTIGDLPVAVSAVDIHTVGAGGGSIAWRDAAGALKVGPQSAGADPGPACYGRGHEPTVTDAHVVLGQLPAAGFLGGEGALYPERAEAAVETLAGSIGLSLEETALGIIRVANAHMVRAIKVISLERGFDPRAFTLVTFGGAGGLHACDLAEALDMTSVLVPLSPGALSALGMLQADYSREFGRTVLERVPAGSTLAASAIRSALAELEPQAAAFFASQDTPTEAQERVVVVDMRYAGQSFELAINLTESLEGAVDRFHRAHERRYGYRLFGRDVEWVALRLRALGRRARPSVTLERFASSQAEAHDGLRGCYPAHWRASLAPGSHLDGPCIISEYTSTTVVRPGWVADVQSSGAVLLTFEGDSLDREQAAVPRYSTAGGHSR